MGIRLLMSRVMNPVMKWLLRSPLHPLVSSGMVLITVTGRKTGKRYTTPVEYKQTGDTVLIISSESYTWWKNLRGGGSTTLVLRGKMVEGTATTSTDPAELREAMRTLYPRMTPAQVEKLSSGCVAIRIQLQPVAEATVSETTDAAPIRA